MKSCRTCKVKIGNRGNHCTSCARENQQHQPTQDEIRAVCEQIRSERVIQRKPDYGFRMPPVYRTSLKH